MGQSFAKTWALSSIDSFTSAKRPSGHQSNTPPSNIEDDDYDNETEIETVVIPDDDSEDSNMEELESEIDTTKQSIETMLKEVLENQRSIPLTRIINITN